MLFPRAAIRRTSLTYPVLRTTPRRPTFNAYRSAYRNMASDAAPLHEWLVIAPDHVGALHKRVEARPRHLEAMKGDREDMWLWGGAMLEEPIQPGSTDPPKMKGSAMLVAARTKEEVIERVKNDVYVGAGVWDIEKIQIIPFKSAVRKPL
ncbi:hypothetical protein T440DRAFT_472395 [Plenodomus tracheiphilus IPT5]|uniref:YCII-related domain-containing protein n=1 Tax=Plenodomus tracheiphilus IPT5 TaxID=1408161 RepID=A0A6A7ARS1_9PLEO|nr:hypothetical protein T440DRAFT_472395 [Plenodomus tracheiphilus IPT5]